MALNEYLDENTGAAVPVRGSDFRTNTSSRGASRFSYNSRDRSQAYTMVFDDASCSSGDINAVIINNRSDGYDMVIKSAAVNAIGSDTLFKLFEITGTASGGAVAATPYRLNRSGKSNNAKVIASTVPNSDSDPITGISELFEVDTVSVKDGGHEEFKLDDGWRLGEGQGLALKTDDTTPGTRVHGVFFIYFEKVGS